MGAVGFVWRAPRRHPRFAATLFVLVATLGSTAAWFLPRLHQARVVITAGSTMGGVLVALLGSAALDWHAAVFLEGWQLRSLKIDVLGELDADLMQRIRRELSPHLPEAPRAGPQNASSWALATTVNVGPPTGMATDAQVVGFRELRTRLMAIAGLQVGPFTVLVVPLVRGSGGSFVARNLAASFTFQDGANALLIDCDFTHPTQHIALCTSDDGGLFDFLDEPHINFAPKPTGVRGLHLIPAGRARSQSGEYFSSSKMSSLMQVIGEGRRFVVLDGPPVDASFEARTLSDLADLVILVVASGKCRAGDIAQAAALFDPAKFAGVVFNERA
jgi:protein-tyrosine kinase